MKSRKPWYKTCMSFSNTSYLVQLFFLAYETSSITLPLSSQFFVFCIFILDYTDIATTSAPVTTETTTTTTTATTTTTTTTTVSVSDSTVGTKALPSDNTDPTSQLGFLHHFGLPCGCCAVYMMSNYSVWWMYLTVVPTRHLGYDMHVKVVAIAVVSCQ